MMHRPAREVSMKSAIAGLFVATMLTTAAIAAQDDPTVSITGCLEKGTQRDGYVISRVTENGPGRSSKAPAGIYWPSNTKGRPDPLGHMGRGTGTIRPDADQGRRSREQAPPEARPG